MELQNAKGTRDIPPEEKIVKQQIVDTLKSAFELYGFSPLETPVLERYDIISAKYAGGSEILKETFKLKDQGGRQLSLRYDLTVPFARFVGMNPNLKMPFKRYQIGEVFRDGPIKLGRYREFWQCDADVVGVKSMKADAEIIALTQDIFKKLGFDFVIKLNSRKILDAVLDYAGVKEEKRIGAILAIDKLEKSGTAEVKKELKSAGISDSSIKKIMVLIALKGTNRQKLAKLKELLNENEGIKEVEEILSYVNIPNLEFSPSLARGLAYYTGTIFEVFLKIPEIKSAVAAGGRYDEMIGKFLGSGDYPAVGIAFGLDVIMDAVKLKQPFEKKAVTDVYIIPIQLFSESFKVAEELRKAGIKADIDLIGRGPSKNLDYVNAMKIPYVLFIGPDELKKKKVKLRDMKSGKEEFLSVADVIRKLR